jgi:hypothetical protein
MIAEDHVAALMRVAAEDIDVPTAPAELLVDSGRRAIRRRRAAGVCAAAATVAAITAGVLVGIGVPGSARTPTGTPGPELAGCITPVPDAVLPPWARGGFSDPTPRMAYVRGHKGTIVAILFGQPLTASPAADHNNNNNKILWVSRLSQEPVTDLRIDAHLVDGSATAHRTVAGGPGPSIVDLPEPGCWHLTLRWSGHTDRLNLAYLPQ